METREKLRTLLQKIQNSEEETKKKWLIGASTVTMLVVIGLWLIYINVAVIKPLNNAYSSDSSKDFWPIMENGFGVIGDELHDLAGKIRNLSQTGMQGLISEIMTENTITIEQK